MSFDPDSELYMDKVQIADAVSLPNRIKQAIDWFVRCCKQDDSPKSGVSQWDAFGVAGLLPGAATLAGSLVPLVGPPPSPSGLWLSGASYSRTLGVQCNGSGSLDSNWPSDADTVGNSHGAVFIAEKGSGVAFRNNSGEWRKRAELGVNFSGRWDRSSNINIVGVGGLGLIGFSSSSPGVASLRIDRETGSYSATPSPATGNMLCYEACTHRGAWYSFGAAIDLVLLESRLIQYMRDIQMQAGRRGFPMSRLVN